MTNGALVYMLAASLAAQLPSPHATKPIAAQSLPAVNGPAFAPLASAPPHPTIAAAPGATYYAPLPPRPAPAAATYAVYAPETVPAPAPTAADYNALLKRLEKLEQDAAARNAAPRSAMPTDQPAEAGKQEAAKKPDEKKDDKAAKDTAGWQDMSTDKWTIKIGGHVQLDYINWADAAPTIPNAQNYFEFRRLRLVAEGTGYGVYDFRLQMTLEPEAVGETPGVTTPEVKDAYFSINELPWFGRARIGNFFVPISLEQVTNDTNGVFMERSIPTQGVFTPDREVGIASYNHTDDLNLTWSYGIFIDSISEALKERIDNNQGYRVVGRATWLPYYDEPSNGRYLVHTGAGILYTDDQDDRVRFRSRPQIHEGPRIIDSLIINANDYVTGNVELASVMGPVTVQSELFATSVNRLDAAPVSFFGSYAHLSYFLTGENRIYERFGQHGAQFARNVPFSNVFWVPGAAGFGAWEAKARWSWLELTQVDRGQYNDFTVGFNWYWSDRTRVMFDYIHPITSSEAIFGATTSDILAMRFDWNW
ncbi:MAG: hypothetical protein K1X74_21720 [Pirellulales bacterium]|nr:hypothetical protein [Pirellulales bacterium]